MALTSAFYEAVQSGNVRRVRIMMKDSLLVDPSFAEFTEMEQTAGKMQGLYDGHDGTEFQLDKIKWNDDYMNDLMVQVVWNFSPERLAHLKDVVRYLRPVAQNTAHLKEKQETDWTKPKGSGGSTGTAGSGQSSYQEQKQRDQAEGRTKPSYQEQKHHDQAEGNYLGAKAAAGVAAGAAVGGIAASIIEVPVVAGVLVGAVAGGAVVYVASSHGEG